MSGKMARNARRIVGEYARRENLWNKGIMPKPTRWQKIKAILSPWLSKARAKAAIDMRGRWYKWALKKLSKQAYEKMHDRDLLAFERKRARMDRKFQSERRKAKIEAGGAG